jgi:hypothetical protein
MSFGFLVRRVHLISAGSAVNIGCQHRRDRTSNGPDRMIESVLAEAGRQVRQLFLRWLHMERLRYGHSSGRLLRAVERWVTFAVLGQSAVCGDGDQ